MSASDSCRPSSPPLVFTRNLRRSLTSLVPHEMHCSSLRIPHPQDSKSASSAAQLSPICPARTQQCVWFGRVALVRGISAKMRTAVEEVY